MKLIQRTNIESALKLNRESTYEEHKANLSNFIDRLSINTINNFGNEIKIVIGDEWYAGNLSYHLSSRPTWYNTIENNLSLITSDTGVIYTGNPKILKKFCPGIYGTIKPIGICMIGAK